MKQKGLLLIISLLLVFPGKMIFAQKTRSLKPQSNRRSVPIVISGKHRSYYWIEDEQPTSISLRGPGKLRVITRFRFEPGSEEKKTYSVMYKVDGGTEQRIKLEDIARSQNATFQNGTLGVPGELSDFTINLDRGYHTIEFWADGGNQQIATRFLFKASHVKNQEWIQYCPLKPSEPVDLVSRESIVNYYRFSASSPIRVEVNGPTQIRVLTRVENHYQMRGRVHYRIQVKENDKVINTYQLSSTRSDITTYKTEKNLIPGKGREFVINVPDGNHVYEIAPLDEDKNTILGRLLLPEKDVKLEN